MVKLVADMSAQLLLAVCLMGATWVRSQGLLSQWFLDDLEVERTEGPQEDHDYKNEQTFYPAGADSFIMSPYEIDIIEPKQLSASVPAEPLIYSITIAKKPLTLFLKKQVFLPKDFQVYIDDEVEPPLSRFIRSMSDCYYSGQILESGASSVTLRTCFGLRGLIEFSNESFIIEPFQLAPGFLHLISRMEGKYGATIFISENDTDVKSHSYQLQLFREFQPSAQLKTSIFGVRRYLKVALFVTVDVFKALGASPTNVITNLMQIFSYLNTKFAPLNMEIFLSSIDLWTVSNLCSIVRSTSDTLENFIVWLSGIPFNLRSYDVPLLIVGGHHTEIGTTYFGQVCSHNNGAVLTYPKGLSIEKYSCLVAHILGHNLGMLHDNSRECTCSASACIMDVNMMTAGNAKSFSSCSLKDFQTFVTRTGAHCLLKHPNINPLVDPSFCGNRMLDSGESCDCGTRTECDTDSCCDHATCTLKLGANCGNGGCCSNCQILPAGTLCRKAVDECDLPEYCSGTNAACPEDLFQQNGNPCDDKRSFCYRGICQNADMQCKQLLGPAAGNADLECYQEQNVKGNRFGNCGGVKGFYASCHTADVLCGKLQCMITDIDTVYKEYLALSYYTTGNHTCVAADSLTDNYPLWVNDGTKCGENKICIKQKCTNISISDLTCDRGTTCNWHGICNNKHKCHCDPGWKPPLCTTPDDARSIHSGRMANDTGNSGENCSYNEKTHLKNWLLVGFLLILPLVLIIICLILKKFILKLFRRDLYEDEDEEAVSGEQCSECPESVEEETQNSEEKPENVKSDL
ncbi:disintegrin and metalloproteinase domain-containing protein 9-like isoform X2 [Pseudophryne corroboree]|uniref:disintegrin and metalloproteinase domain-containing protein 9-like isoform X2 n=1 Tax=Pseudophryne corroboree TaxID=495146 RepID=UPI0030815420